MLDLWMHFNQFSSMIITVAILSSEKLKKSFLAGWIIIITFVSWFAYENISLNMLPVLVLLQVGIILWGTEKKIMNICLLIFSTLLAVVTSYLSQLLSPTRNFHIVTLSHTMLMLFFAYLFKIFLKEKQLHAMLESPHSKIILGLLSATFLIFYADIIIGSYLGFSTEVLFGRGMILACYLIVIFIIFKAFTQSVKKEKDLEGKVLESMLKEQSFEILKEQILSAMKTHEQTLRIHHDMKNMLLGFEGYLKSGDSKGMKDYYYSSVLPQHEKIDKEELYLLPLVRLENIAIQGMLRGKLADAMNLGVEVSLELEDEIQEISMNPIDLIRVLGILLDNAIEAALETNAPVIKMAFIKEENRLLIVVQNNFKGEIPFDEMYRHGFSTKGEDRGIGLSNLAEILEESEGVQVYHEVEGDLFVQHLEIIGGD